ncbi:MAG: glycosyltransferase family 4 protein [Alphaproteobacteria bacterium]|jgi:glycosyltransferase involved in cell wall biosynthesis|nr:glycosyltransferase family 4 protein [Alphaproteobacteria bacterium]MBP9878122.1 glycosyltransferase family 4 protein [Alphaproteobacteria bacterium]
MTNQSKKKLLFIVTEDWYFYSHRLPIAELALKQGFEVHVACKIDKHEERIREKGFIPHALNWERSDLSPRTIYKNQHEIATIISIVQPDIINYIAMKPILIGALLACQYTKFNNIKKIYSFTGLGTLFTSKKLIHQFIRMFAIPILKFGLKRPNSFYIFQNDDDFNELRFKKIFNPEFAALIRGSGVDEKHFQPSPLPPLKEGIKFCTIARMLKDKGIEQCVEAHQHLWADGYKSELWLVGDPDPENPTSYSPETLKQWAKLPGILWLGHQSDVREILKKAHVSILMSKREGLPKSLLESNSCGRPIIASDVPGCRSMVHNNVNGFKVPFANIQALKIAMKLFIEEQAPIQEMAKASRELILNGFTADTIAKQTIDFYNKTLIEQ